MQRQSVIKADYRWHRLALACEALPGPRAELEHVLTTLSPGEIPAFADFLVWHKLAPLWHHRLEATDLLGSIDIQSAGSLRANHIAAAALYMAQRQALEKIDLIFARKAIPYAAIKGASVREYLYPDAGLRPANDIDILVHPTRRMEAGRALIEAGYLFHGEPENISHEATFTRGGIAIDLHWNILRTGRTRCDAVPGLLERRRRQDIHWSLSPADTVVMMLIHPAFTKYVTSPNMALICVVDFIRCLRQQRVDWNPIVSLLEEMGLKTAAWTVLTWFRMIAPNGSLAKTDDVCIQLQPGPARRRYLSSWVTKDLATRWLNRPLPIQLGLTLPLHDRPSDAARAIAGWMQSRSARHTDPMLQLGRACQALAPT